MADRAALARLRRYGPAGSLTHSPSALVATTVTALRYC